MKRLLKNARVLTMTDGAVPVERDILINDGIIEALIPRGGVCDTAADTVDDLGSCVVMPGLFDCHVHFDADYMAPFFLAAGVTSVRNMRGMARHAAWRDEIFSGKRFGPYIYSSGPIGDGEDETLAENDNIILRTTADVDALVEYTLGCGFLWMKTYPSIEPELYEYLMRRCREVDLPLCGHMTKKMSHRALTDGGYICCEHTSSLPSDPEDIRYIAEQGIWLCPTHVVCETMPDYVWGGKQLTDLEHFADLPAFVRKEWEEKNRVIIEMYHKYNVHPDFNIIIERGRTFIKYSSPEKIMAGTDCAYPGIIPGYAMADELERLVRVYGLTPYEALCAATVNPARHIGVEAHKGRVREGMDADMIVLTDNPAQDIAAIRKVLKVYQGKNTWTAEELASRVKAAGRLGREETEIIECRGGSPDTALR